jgi:L-rhamnose mutarotase
MFPGSRARAVIRKAFVMSVNPGMEAAYERLHNPIWPELERVLKEFGVGNYSIFLHPGTRQLFAYVEIESEGRWDAIAQTPECRRWWRHMAQIMPLGSDGAPVAIDLKEVFHLA